MNFPGSCEQTSIHPRSGTNSRLKKWFHQSLNWWTIEFISIAWCPSEMLMKTWPATTYIIFGKYPVNLVIFSASWAKRVVFFFFLNKILKSVLLVLLETLTGLNFFTAADQSSPYTWSPSLPPVSCLVGSTYSRNVECQMEIWKCNNSSSPFNFYIVSDSFWKCKFLKTLMKPWLSWYRLICRPGWD